MFRRIRKNIELLNVYRHGKSYANKYLVMYVLNNHLGENRFGITVSKKVGNSVVRHRTTRLIRESIRLQESNILTEYDIVVVARKAAKDKGMGLRGIQVKLIGAFMIPVILFVIIGFMIYSKCSTTLNMSSSSPWSCNSM